MPDGSTEVVEPEAAETTAVHDVAVPTEMDVGVQLTLVEEGMGRTSTSKVPELDVWLPSPE